MAKAKENFHGHLRRNGPVSGVPRTYFERICRNEANDHFNHLKKLAEDFIEDDTGLIDLVSGLGDHDAYRETQAERMFLHVLQGHCNSPIVGYARVERNGELSLRATVFSPDGKVMLHAHEWAGRLDPATLGTSVAVALLRQGARELIDGIAH